jgi:hypothetical protein
MAPCRGLAVGAMGGSPGVPYLAAELAAIGNGYALEASPGADFCGGRLWGGGRVVELGFLGGGYEAAGGGGLRFGPGLGGGEEPVGPLLGELAGLAEHDRDVRPADLEFGEAVRDQRGPRAVELEDGRVAVLDHDGGPGKGGELGQGVAELPAGDAGHQVGQRLAFHRGDEPVAVGETVVAAGQRSFQQRRLLTGEPVRVLLVAVDHNLQVGDPGGAGGRGAHVRAGLLAGPG